MSSKVDKLDGKPIDSGLRRRQLLKRESSFSDFENEKNENDNEELNDSVKKKAKEPVTFKKVILILLKVQVLLLLFIIIR